MLGIKSINQRFPRHILAYQIYLNDILYNYRSFGLSFGIRNGINGFSELADPVIERTNIDILPLAPLIIGKTALTTFHDEPDLLIFSDNSFLHNDWLLWIE